MADFSLLGGHGKIEKIATDETTTTGTAIGVSGSANKESSWAELESSISFDVYSLIVILQQKSGTMQSGNAFVDVAIGTAGNEEIIIENLHYSGGPSGTEMQVTYHTGLQIKSGQRLSARVQSSQTSKDMYIHLIAYQNNFLGCAGAGKSIVFGDDSTSTIGVQIDAGATANTKGAWAEITSSLAEDIKAFIFIVGNNQNGSLTDASSFLFDIGIGSAGNEETILPDALCKVHFRNYLTHESIAYPISIPAGTRIAARCQSSTNDATDRILTIVCYGMI